MRTTDDQKISSIFAFLLDNGYELIRDYRKDTDSCCAQLYRFQLNVANYLEYRVVSEKECTLCVCVRGEKSFPNLRMRYKSLVWKWKFKALFKREMREEWALDAYLLQEEAKRRGSYCKLPLTSQE